jgi:hypothetical protein
MRRISYFPAGGLVVGKKSIAAQAYIAKMVVKPTLAPVPKLHKEVYAVCNGQNSNLRGPHDETMGSVYFCFESTVFGKPWRLKG